MSTYTPLTITIPIEYIPSENQRLTKGHRLSAVALNYKSSLSSAFESLNSEDFYEKYPYLTEDYSFDIIYHFVLNNNFWRRDTDNMIKMTQDVLFDWLELNDSSVISISATKFYAPSASSEYITIRIEPSKIKLDLYEEKFR